MDSCLARDAVARLDPVQKTSTRGQRLPIMTPVASHTFPAAHLLQLVELAARWNVADSRLLSEVGLSKAQLSEPGRTLPLDVALALYERARTLTGEPGLGIYLGLQMRASAHGFVGLAAMTAATLGEAIALMFQYAPTRTTAIKLHGHLEGEAAVLSLDEQMDFGVTRDLVLFAITIGLWQGACALTGREVKLTLELMIDEPDYYARFAHQLLPVSFGCPANRLVGRSGGLSTPLVLADAEACRLAAEQCERALTSLGLDGRIAERVRAVLRRDDHRWLSLDDVAQDLGLSTRTLRRRLTSEGASFAALSHGVRKDRALALLRSASLSIDDIAERLGYATTPAFTRAFQQWTGTTPTAYRRK